jgi:hypothetical protein
MEYLRRLLAVLGSVTVHMVGSLMVVDQSCHLPAIVAKDQEHHGVALDRPPRPAEADHDALRKGELDRLLVGYYASFSSSGDGLDASPGGDGGPWFRLVPRREPQQSPTGAAEQKAVSFRQPRDFGKSLSDWLRPTV